MNKYLCTDDIENFSREFNSSRANKAAANAVISVGFAAAAKNRPAAMNAVHEYSLRLDNHGVSNQKQSGRCWMFAALNCLRYEVIHKLNLDSFELSQNYTCFYDKLEKANYFYETILETADEQEESRVLDFILRDPVQDGGQWDMISAILIKYGAVPQSAMPESACSLNTSEMNKLLHRMLRRDAAILRKACKDGKSPEELETLKESMLSKVYRVLCICLGKPPEKFDFKIRTKDGRYISDCALTPWDFYDKYIGIELSQYISLINAPTNDKPYYKSYTVQFLGNVLDGSPVKYVNVPIDVMKKAAIAQMKDGVPVWFGCDVGKYSDRVGGTLDLKAYDYETLLSTKFTMDKADRLEYGHSLMTHAMTFQGVDLDENGQPVRWCVENSWGSDPGNKGMYLMTDEWFDQYMYQVVVKRRYLDSDVLKAYDSEPTVLAPWDPMGSLAKTAH